MNRELAQKIADAVLYEGYMLYPYRPVGHQEPAALDRLAFSIRRIIPRSEAAQSAPSCIRNACCEQEKMRASESVAFCTSFTQAVRTVWSEFELDGFEWDLKNPQRCFQFRYSRGTASYWRPVSASCEPIADGVLKLTIEFANTTPSPPDALDRDAALLRSLLSAHTILTVSGGEFVSLLDPPEELRASRESMQERRQFPGARRRPGRARHVALLAHPALRLSADRAGERGRLL